MEKKFIDVFGNSRTRPINAANSVAESTPAMRVDFTARYLSPRSPGECPAPGTSSPGQVYTDEVHQKPCQRAFGQRLLPGSRPKVTSGRSNGKAPQVVAGANAMFGQSKGEITIAPMMIATLLPARLLQRAVCPSMRCGSRSCPGTCVSWLSSLQYWMHVGVRYRGT